MDLSGLGNAALHVIPTNSLHQIDLAALNAAIARDRNAGLTPFLLVGTAGAVDTGAIDDLAALAAIASREKLWFHVDGAIGALAIMAPDIAPRLAGIQQAELDRARFPQMGAGALRCRVHPGARRRAAPCHLRFARGLSAARNTRARRRRAMALRFRPRSVARLSRAEDLVHAESLRRRRAGCDDVAHVRARPLPRDQDRHFAGARTARAGFAQHRVLPAIAATIPTG